MSARSSASPGCSPDRTALASACRHEGRSEAATAYAARFAAKEALVKALGAPAGVRWQDMEVLRAASGAPTFALTGVAAREVGARKARVLLALTHDGGVAAATVVLDSA